MDNERLAEIEERVKASQLLQLYEDDLEVKLKVTGEIVAEFASAGDAVFFARAGEDVRDLVYEVRRLTALNAELQAENDHLRSEVEAWRSGAG